MKLSENQEKWLQALESGKYKKGIGLLCHIGNKEPTPSTSEQYCCLGVACEIFKEEAKLEAKDISNARYYEFSHGDEHGMVCNILPDSLLDILGLRDTVGGFTTSQYMHGLQFGTLTALNDVVFREDTDFKRVAAFIRENASIIFK